MKLMPMLLKLQIMRTRKRNEEYRRRKQEKTHKAAAREAIPLKHRSRRAASFPIILLAISLIFIEPIRCGIVCTEKRGICLYIICALAEKYDSYLIRRKIPIFVSETK